MLERGVTAAFGMDEATWARHANPWSVWTRNTVLPLLVIAFWSRVWLGWWAAVPVALALLWTWLNPRLFPIPDSTDNWASKAVLGERVWLNRKAVPVPAHHRAAPVILAAVAGVGALGVVWGVVALAPWPTVTGALMVYLGKLWFLDRMVWLYEDMRKTVPAYARWLY